MTVIMDMAAERNDAPEGTGTTDGKNPAAVSQSEHTGLSAVQTKLILEKDAKVTLVQIIRNKNAKTVFERYRGKRLLTVRNSPSSTYSLAVTGSTTAVRLNLSAKRVILQQTSPTQLPMTACSI